jgi:hypothetical protein
MRVNVLSTILNLCKFVNVTEVTSGGSLAWAIMALSLFSRLRTACLLYLYVINVIYLVPNKAVKKKSKKIIIINHT